MTIYSMSAIDSAVYAVGIDSSGAVVLAKSDDGGANFTAIDIADGESPSMATSDNNAYIAWVDDTAEEGNSSTGSISDAVAPIPTIFIAPSCDSLSLASKIFYTALAAGIAFMAIGIASSIYSNMAVDVPLDYTLRPGMVDVITPDMNAGSTASITASGSTFDVKIRNPDGQVVESEGGASSYSYDFTAQKPGEHRITVNNTGSADVTIGGYAQTKSSPLGLSGALMLVVTGIIVVGLGMRFGRR